jgi:hypothetical protein
MADDALLELVKSIDGRTARMETAMTTTLEKHDDRIKSLETSRTAARAGMTVLALGSTTGAAKMGFLDKVIGIFGGGS